MSRGWIAVDFDGTLAVYNGWVSPEHTGEPIQPMVDRVKGWIEEGKDVRIFTARIYAAPDNADMQWKAARSLLAIQSWSQMYLGKILPVTCTKDFGMIELWDDRCTQVEPNTGRVEGGALARTALRCAPTPPPDRAAAKSWSAFQWTEFVENYFRWYNETRKGAIDAGS